MATKQGNARSMKKIKKLVCDTLVRVYPRQISTGSLVARVQERFQRTERAAVIRCLVELSRSNLVIASPNTEFGGYFWKVVMYTTSEPGSVREQNSDRPLASVHQITRHVSKRELEAEVLAYFEKGGSYAYATQDVIVHCEIVFGDAVTREQVKDTLKVLTDKGLVASFKSDHVRTYRWYLLEGIDPPLEELRPYIMQLVSDLGSPSTQEIVDHIRWDTNRRILYRTVSEALKSMAEEGVLSSVRHDNQRHYKWFFANPE